MSSSCKSPMCLVPVCPARPLVCGQWGPDSEPLPPGPRWLELEELEELEPLPLQELDQALGQLRLPSPEDLK